MDGSFEKKTDAQLEDEVKAFLEAAERRQYGLLVRFYLLGALLMLLGVGALIYAVLYDKITFFWPGLALLFVGGWLSFRLKTIFNRANEVDDGSN